MNDRITQRIAYVTMQAEIQSTPHGMPCQLRGAASTSTDVLSRPARRASRTTQAHTALIRVCA